MARRSMSRAIAEKCIDCSGGQKREVENCPIKNCPLYPYRMGKAEKEPKTDARKTGKKKRRSA